jgi:hypothetical protein
MKPVAYQVWDRMGGISFRLRKPDESEYVEWDALYAAPPKRKWVGLTDEELEPMCDDWRIIFGPYVHDFAKAIY